MDKLKLRAIAFFEKSVERLEQEPLERLSADVQDNVLQNHKAAIVALQDQVAREENGADRFTEAFGSIAHYNGHNEWLWEIADQLAAHNDSNYSCEIPTDEWMTDKHALWMMLVSAFGDWGTSIRFGWIEHTKAAAEFINEATERYADGL